MGELRFEFGRFWIDPADRILWWGNQRIALTPKATETLLALVENAGELLHSRELRARVWPGVAVGDGSLHRNVSDLRKALSTHDRDEYIETIAKRGYRFVAHVRRVARGDPATLVGVRIWVRPSTRDRESRASCERLEQATTAKLHRIGALSPRRLRTRRAPPAGELLVELGVSRVGARLTVSAVLSHGRGTRAVWAEMLEYLGESFASEDELAEQVAGAVALWISQHQRRSLSRRHTQNSDAYRFYLRGRLHVSSRNEASLRAAATCFERALRADAEYALAYAGLARAYALMPMVAAMPAAHFMPRARAAAANALAIDETLHEARAVLAFVKWHFQWDWPGAERELRRIVHFQPRDATSRQWYGLMLCQQRRFGPAIEQVMRARLLEPTSPDALANLATVLHFAGDYSGALKWSRRALALRPPPVRARLVAGWASEQVDGPAAALGDFELAMADAPRSPMVLCALGHALAAMRREQAVEKVLARLDRLPSSVTHYSRAIILAARERIPEAIANLTCALDDRDFQLVAVRVDPRLADVRSHPDFAQIERGMAGAL